MALQRWREKDDMIIIMGAGDIRDITDSVYNKIEKKEIRWGIHSKKQVLKILFPMEKFFERKYK